MKKEICAYCHHFTFYYTKSAKGFFEKSNGFCSKFRKVQKEYDTCENFKDNHKRELDQYDRLLKGLEDAVNSVNEIAQILKENHT